MINSEYLGMTFWLDDDNEFCYCPTFTNNKPDKDNWGYVVEWDDYDCYINELFAIHRKLVTTNVLKTVVQNEYKEVN